MPASKRTVDPPAASRALRQKRNTEGPSNSADQASHPASVPLHPQISGEASQDSEGEDSDEDAEELILDEDGRIFGPSGAIDYTFRAYDHFLQLKDVRRGKHSAVMSQLISDCEAVFVEQSFFLPANISPRTTLEQLAQTIFAFHTEGVNYNQEKSGAEWWVQIRRGGDNEESIGFHWDKDEDLGLIVHPQISTVTYLTDYGAPTLIIDKLPPSDYYSSPESEEEAEVDEDGAEEAAEGFGSGLYGQVGTGWYSCPRLGKHISFDGRYLHGAPAELLGEAVPGRLRVSFLVNIWLDYTPTGPEILPDELLPTLRPAGLLGIPASLHAAKQEWLGNKLMVSQWPLSQISGEGVEGASAVVEWMVGLWGFGGVDAG
eukprot:gene6931-8267_t